MFKKLLASSTALLAVLAGATPTTAATLASQSLSATTATRAVEAGSTKVTLPYIWISGILTKVHGGGTLSWDGEGGYSFTGEVYVTDCNGGAPVTGWIEYGGVTESWKQTAQGDCRPPAPANVKVSFSGTLKKGEQLEMRLSSWRGGKINAYKAGKKLLFTIS